MTRFKTWWQKIGKWFEPPKDMKKWRMMTDPFYAYHRLSRKDHEELEGLNVKLRPDYHQPKKQ